MHTPTYEYVTFISATPEKVWDALTKSEHTEQYFFGTAIQSDWKVGSRVQYSRDEPVEYGEILRIDPLNEMTYTWENDADETVRTNPTIVTFKVKDMGGGVVKLTLIHENLVESDYEADSNTFQGYNNGWPFIMSNLKSYLETGKTLDIHLLETLT